MTAALVYVNYGVPADYEESDRRISVAASSSSRVMASWRGIKPKIAAENTVPSAASSILIRAMTATTRAETYPAGYLAPTDGVTTGSVLDIPVAPGDPLTPGPGQPQTPGGSIV